MEHHYQQDLYGDKSLVGSVKLDNYDIDPMMLVYIIIRSRSSKYIKRRC